MNLAGQAVSLSLILLVLFLVHEGLSWAELAVVSLNTVDARRGGGGGGAS